MFTFEVNDMTCGHCVGAITKAVSLIDPGAKLQIDLSSHRVQIEPTTSTLQALSEAITSAGFTPTAVADAAPRTAQAPPRKGCCCN